MIIMIMVIMIINFSRHAYFVCSLRMDPSTESTQFHCWVEAGGSALPGVQSYALRKVLCFEINEFFM